MDSEEVALREALSKQCADRFFRDGFCVVRGGLAKEQLTAIFEAVSTDCKEGRHSEASYMGGVDLAEPRTWPRKKIGTHRVLEVVPGQDSKSAFEALNDRPSLLSEALDAIMGNGWKVHTNSTPLETRHWYCPVTFPENLGCVQLRALEAASSGTDSSAHAISSISHSNEMEKQQCGVKRSRQASGFSSLPSTSQKQKQKQSNCDSQVDHDLANEKVRSCVSKQVDEDAHFCVMAPMKELFNQSPMRDAFKGKTCPENLASKLWQPINRRRVVGRGWHIDVGPGFENEGLRTVAGDSRQGVVLLLLLSDWNPGAGGTVLVPGSHGWVYAQIKQHDDDRKPLTHSELNKWVVARMRELVTSGRVMLTGDNVETHTPSHWNSQGPVNADCRGVQITGKAGDVVLMHPLLVHSGTTNLCPHLPRLLANGMACISDPDVFKRNGDPMMAAAKDSWERTFIASRDS